MLKSLTNIVVEAGKIIEVGIDSKKDINYKSNVDMVTNYDIETEAVLKEKISKLFPNHKIIAEESGMRSSDNQGDVIYIDPIDGTTNFVHGFPFVSISVGVYNNNVGTYGIVYNPIMGELFTASKNGGAYLNGKEIHVSRTDTLEHSLCATGFPYLKDNLSDLMPILEKTLRATRGIRRAGSAALDLCYVAKGVFDLYYETTLNAWDISAGIIIVREAGGIVTNMDGTEQDLSSHALISSNGLVHNEFMELLKK